VAGHVDAPFSALGTDGFGRSDTRTALRRFFEVDRHHVALAALDALRREGTLDAALCAAAIARYGIDAARAAPWQG
jgi:pyruvate dehydrogenase E1 component